MVSDQIQDKVFEINLRTSVRFLKGVGPERCKILSRLGLETLEDLFYFFPRRYENRSPIIPVSKITGIEKECVEGQVMSRGLIRTRHGPAIFKMVVADVNTAARRTPPLFVSWFNRPYLSKVFLPKSKVVLYGKAEKESKGFHMIHPEYEILDGNGEKEIIHSGRIVPIYPLTEDLSQKSLRHLIFSTVHQHAGLIKNFLPGQDLAATFKEIHFPENFDAQKKAYERLVFNEFFLMQLLVQMKKAEFQKENAGILHGKGDERLEYFLQSLEYSLTQGQSQALGDIIGDMKKGRPMNRLIQGEVGSGKTVIAAAALLFTAANGFQGALMAPTEVLAQQHYFYLTRMLEPLGLRCGYLAQGLSPSDREKTLSEMLQGTLDIVVGTHALIEKEARFKKLGLAVVDEQHKFGVFQRGALKEKAQNPPHFLVMTATPIPRTLALTLYGDLDISAIRELPKGRKPITTSWVSENKREAVYRFLDEKLGTGGQAYVVCPLIGSEKTVSAKSVIAAYKELTQIFAHRRVGILHGRMKGEEKKKIMNAFKNHGLDLLVSTVVIEVGVDVPNANVMIVENADKFGLAQLHQLRGRVGRGFEESFCILFSNTDNPESVERLGAFEKMESGFDVAEKDLALRGAGDIVGEKQHGIPELRIGDLVRDIAILEKARKEAMALVEKDPKLERPEHRLLKKALHERFKVLKDKRVVLA